jgi:hypothetical protein
MSGSGDLDCFRVWSTAPGLQQHISVKARAIVRRAPDHYWPQWTALAWLTLGVGILLTIGACRAGVPVIDTGPRPAEAQGTISGTVRGPESTSSIEGRIVEVVNLDTNERQKGTTNNAGGFTFKVKPGRYRVELTLREGESLIKQPGILNVNRSDVDAHADFVIGSGRIARPRGPGYRVDHGLGSPIA